MSRVVVTDRERVAVVALEQIAARGVVIYSHVEPARNGQPFKMHRCPACKELQEFGGSCANRDCLTAIARDALDDLRRLA